MPVQASKESSGGTPTPAEPSTRQQTEPSSRQAAENAKAPLVKLADRFSSYCTEHLAGIAERWPEVQSLARRRRQTLCRAFLDLGVDTRGIVEAATEAVRVRPSRAFLSGSAKRHRRQSLLDLATPKRGRRLSKMVHRRRPKKELCSDDDSDAPSTQKPRLAKAVDDEPRDRAKGKQQRHHSREVRDEHISTGNPKSHAHLELSEYSKRQRQVLAMGF